jgi:large subunit ribosomal protein L21
MQLFFRLHVRLAAGGVNFGREPVSGIDAVLLYPPRHHNPGNSRGMTELCVCRANLEVSVMYAVIRTGGKQYVVSPGEQLKVERTANQNGTIEFSDVLAISGGEGKFEKDLSGAKVTATVVQEGRGDKILVFKLKRKKQYKKMQGHRQNYVQVRINEILINGQSFKG